MNARRLPYRLNRLRRQLVFGSLVTLSTAALAGCGDQGAIEGLARGRSGRVTAVLSGDSLEIDGGEQVRLAGVEAPKLGQPYGPEAADALGRLVDGRRIDLLHGGARQDPFGRTVAHVRLPDRAWVQGEMLGRGALRVRTFADNRALAGAMLAREARARAAALGLWRLGDYRVLLPEEVGGDRTGLQIVEGRVERVGRGAGGAIYLDFERDWRTGFSAEIVRGAAGDFRSAGIDPYDLQGRLVRVRGALNGRRMLIDHPEQLERLKG
jgi:endonuclease YncB( thermonuclease family)